MNYDKLLSFGSMTLSGRYVRNEVPASHHWNDEFTISPLTGSALVDFPKKSQKKLFITFLAAE